MDKIIKIYMTWKKKSSALRSSNDKTLCGGSVKKNHDTIYCVIDWSDYQEE